MLNTNAPIVKPKNAFEETLSKLDLQGVLLLLTVLSERALYLQSKDILDKKPLLDAKGMSILGNKDAVQKAA